jgi:hypothetical protein
MIIMKKTIIALQLSLVLTLTGCAGTQTVSPGIRNPAAINDNETNDDSIDTKVIKIAHITSDGRKVVLEFDSAYRQEAELLGHVKIVQLLSKVTLRLIPVYKKFLYQSKYFSEKEAPIENFDIIRYQLIGLKLDELMKKRLMISKLNDDGERILVPKNFEETLAALDTEEKIRAFFSEQYNENPLAFFSNISGALFYNWVKICSGKFFDVF